MILQSESWRRVCGLIEKRLGGEALTDEEAGVIYRLDARSPEAHLVRWAGDRLARELADNTAEIHAQIGLDAGPCTRGCRFCSFASCNNPAGPLKRTPLDAVLRYAEAFRKSGANLILLMTSAAFPFEELPAIIARVRETVGPDFPLLINTRDLDQSEARLLRSLGINGAYHAVRLSEGELTDIPVEQRIRTLDNLTAAGLPLSYCIEPLGAEHTPADFLDRLHLHLRHHPVTGGVGRRIPVRGTGVEHCRKFDQMEQALFIALYRLLDPETVLVGSANATLAANAGANLFWAESGYNPRDFSAHTEADGVGRSVAHIARIYEETGWTLRKGPSAGWVFDR